MYVYIFAQIRIEWTEKIKYDRRNFPEMYCPSSAVFSTSLNEFTTCYSRTIYNLVSIQITCIFVKCGHTIFKA